MFTLDGSDTTWLIYADYLDDNGNYQQAEIIREEVLAENNYWSIEFDIVGVGSDHDEVGNTNPVGTIESVTVGGDLLGLNVGGIVACNVGGDGI